jgi:hypothetical protein
MPPRTNDGGHAITLLIGVPLDYEAFRAAVRGSDWLSKFDEPFLDGVERERALRLRWESQYEPLVADPIEHVLRLARANGLRVETRATLDSLRHIGGERLVVLFGHWKAWEVSPSDLHAADRPPRALAAAMLERASGSDTATARRLCEELRDFIAHADGSPPRSLKRLFRPSPRKTLREILSDAIVEPSADDPAPGNGVDEVLEHESVRLARRREEIDRLFQGLLRPGNLLELFDGLHAKEAVGEALPADFDGILDLTTCTSTILSEYLIRERDYELRTIQFPTPREFARAAPAVLSALRLHLEQGVPYLEARALVVGALAAIAKAKSQKQPT